ncbi:MAG: hypothetical protein COA97_07860 [Flavobacteriales bacterium]|nr:MAG: hypothetical protein COA97_07860 [Flavobacteriales bacterium]
MLKQCLLISILFISVLGFSQEEDSYVFGDSGTGNSTKSNNGGGFDWDRVTVGGGFGLTFGSYTVIEISPTFGYYLTDNILAGVGGFYTYYKDNDFNYSTYIYGGRVFGEYLFNDVPFLAHAELEVVDIQWTLDERKTLINPYIGGGLKQIFGGGSYFYILVLYNLNETKESYLFQPNPIIRGGIAIGL